MATTPPNVPIRVRTPELEPEKDRTWGQFLMRQTPSRRFREPANVAPPPAPAAQTPAQRQADMRNNARNIDRVLNDADMQRNYINVTTKQGPFSRLDYQPNIRPTDQIWKDQFQFFQREITNKSIQHVIEENFLEWQQNLLMPPIVNGAILKVQNDKTEQYKEALKNDFSTVQDNMLTKLTMLHFGLPVEPFTLNNILNAGTDANDPADSPEEPPRVQRIMYSEAPLEFLDGYGQRSYGYPMIRTKSQLHLRGAGADEEDLSNADLLDSDGDINMRGGAGTTSMEELGARPKVFCVEEDNTTSLIEVGTSYDSVATRVCDELQIFRDVELHVVYFRSNGNGTWKKEGSSPFSRMVFEAEIRWRLNENIKKPDTYVVALMSGDQRYTSNFWPLTGVMKSVDSTIVQLPRSQPPTSSPVSGRVYGYAGQLIVNSDSTTNDCKAAFRLAALDLLHLSESEDWAFQVDLVQPPGSPSLFYEAVSFNKATFDAAWNQYCQVNTSADGWKAFVRTKTQPDTVTLEPGDLPNVVQLHLKERGTAYWKLPDSGTNPSLSVVLFGPNQMQDDFFRAMQVLFPARLPRPVGEVSLQNTNKFDLGYGGMEVTQMLSEEAEYINAHNRLCSLSSQGVYEKLEFDVVVETPNIAAPLGIRLANTLIAASSTLNKESDTTKHFFDAVSKTIPRSLPDPERPISSFRLWRSAIDRETNAQSTVISVSGTKTRILASLEDFLGTDLQQMSDCIWFKFELDSVTGYLIDENNPTSEVTWKPKTHNTLAGFRSLLKTLFQDTSDTAADFFVMKDCRTHARFVIDVNTTEEQWRRNVFDNLVTPDWIITRDDPFVYGVDATTPWGLTTQKLAAPSVLPRANSTPLTKPISTGLKSGGTTPKSSPSSFPSRLGQGQSGGTSITLRGGAVGRTAGGSGSRLQAVGGNMSRAQAATRFNRDRLLKPKVSEPKPVTYKTHMTNQNYQYDLKHKSFTQDLSVVEPGRAPAIPIFGPVKQMKLSVGSSFPEIYCQPMTPSDHLAVSTENRLLRSHILERTHQCHWCSESFAAHEHDKIRAHMDTHRKQLEEGGDSCPVCGDKAWLFMSQAQRRSHLFVDFDRHADQIMKDFFKNMNCPICDLDFTEMDPKLPIKHMAQHNPDVIKYCDRCGRDQEILSLEEKIHHTRMCTESNEAFDEREYCKMCGVLFADLTPKQRLKHDKKCVATHFNFCSKCAIPLSSLKAVDRRVHEDNCKHPAGAPKSFCTRCGINRLGLSNLEKEHHKQSCYMSDPRPRPTTYLELQQLEKQNAVSRQLRSSIRAEQLKLDADKAKFDRAVSASIMPRSCPFCPESFEFQDNITHDQIIEHFKTRHDPTSNNATSSTPQVSTPPIHACTNNRNCVLSLHAQTCPRAPAPAPVTCTSATGCPLRDHNTACPSYPRLPALAADATPPTGLWRPPPRSSLVQQPPLGTATVEVCDGTTNCRVPIHMAGCSKAPTPVPAPSAVNPKAGERVQCPYGSQFCKYIFQMPFSLQEFAIHFQQSHSPQGTGEALTCPFPDVVGAGICQNSFRYENNPFRATSFVDHVQKVHFTSAKKVKCPLNEPALGCGDDFCIDSLVAHFAKHGQTLVSPPPQPKKKVKCPLNDPALGCDGEFCVDSLVGHLEQHAQQPPRKANCPFKDPNLGCNSDFCIDGLVGHLAIHCQPSPRLGSQPAKKVQCPLNDPELGCNEEFCIDELVAHLAKHDQQAYSTVKCKVNVQGRACSRVFRNIQDAYFHMKSHVNANEQPGTLTSGAPAGNNSIRCQITTSTGGSCDKVLDSIQVAYDDAIVHVTAANSTSQALPPFQCQVITNRIRCAQDLTSAAEAHDHFIKDHFIDRLPPQAFTCTLVVDGQECNAPTLTGAREAHDHMRIFHSDTPTSEPEKCPFKVGNYSENCEYYMSDAKTFVGHLANVHGIIPFYGQILCGIDTCSHMLTNVLDTVDHFKTKHWDPDANLKCTIKDGIIGECPVVLTTARKALDHIVKKHMRNVTCNLVAFTEATGENGAECELDFNSAVGLYNHFMQVHYEFPEETDCGVLLPDGVVCADTYLTAAQGVEHLRSHIEKMTASPYSDGESKFLCPLARAANNPTSCGAIVDVPTSGNKDAIKAFIRHFQHTSAFGGPDRELFIIDYNARLEAAYGLRNTFQADLRAHLEVYDDQDEESIHLRWLIDTHQRDIDGLIHTIRNMGGIPYNPNAPSAPVAQTAVPADVLSPPPTGSRPRLQRSNTPPDPVLTTNITLVSQGPSYPSMGGVGPSTDPDTPTKAGPPTKKTTAGMETAPTKGGTSTPGRGVSFADPLPPVRGGSSSKSKSTDTSEMMRGSSSKGRSSNAGSGTMGGTMGDAPKKGETSTTGTRGFFSDPWPPAKEGSSGKSKSNNTSGATMGGLSTLKIGGSSSKEQSTVTGGGIMGRSSTRPSTTGTTGTTGPSTQSRPDDEAVQTITTGFETSPEEEFFHQHRKRKGPFAQLPGENDSEYNKRMKRQRVESQNRVELQGADEDRRAPHPSVRASPGPSARLKAAMTGGREQTSAVKSRKRRRGDEENEQGDGQGALVSPKVAAARSPVMGLKMRMPGSGEDKEDREESTPREGTSDDYD